MEDKLEKILLDINIGRITVKVAKRKILRLFRLDSDLDITRCPKCKSTDHTMITGQPYKCMDCGNKWA